MKYIAYKIITNALGNRVAEFILEFPMPGFNNQGLVYDWRHDKESLEIRIKNMKKNGKDTELEEKALAELS